MKITVTILMRDTARFLIYARRWRTYIKCLLAIPRIIVTILHRFFLTLPFIRSSFLFFIISSFIFSTFAEEPWSISRRHSVTKEVKVQKKHHHDSNLSVSSLVFLFYQNYISSLDGATCHYRPTCSRYTVSAINRFGLFKGLMMGSDRLIRCHSGQTEHFYDPPVDYDKFKLFAK